MRTNLPVTGKEVRLGMNDLLVSRTDPRGVITYVNPAFVRVSGFTADALIGQPHNIIRHPDMPPAAFADLWRALKAGRPWTGLVKNRTRTGDHYWVRANVTPIRERGQITGYLSVRTAPQRTHVEAAERAYQTLRGPEASKWTVENGAIVRRGLPMALLRLRRMPITVRMGGFLVGLLGALGVVVAAQSMDAPWTRPVTIATAAFAAAWTVAGWAWLHMTWLRPLTQAREAAELTASGDLGGRFPASADPGVSDLMKAMSQTTVNVRAIIDDVGRSVHGLHQWAHEIASGNGALAERTDAQSAALKQTAGNIEQLTHTVRQTADSAERVDSLARTAAGQAEQGGQAVERVVQTMHSIAQASDRIGKIVGVIDTIAFQTNILALNAAVEAARAGDEGKGFAVVAGEVRSLATRCTAAAAEISTLIRDSIGRVQDGAASVDEAGSTMNTIVHSVQQVSGLVSEIASASHAQSAGLDRINEAIVAMERATEHNARMVEDTTRLAGSLEAQADLLASTVGRIRVDRAAS
ncbi:MAG TPA: methyl-accepting chemotaxis protein [Quisquiliibacterium sp.]|nr:methyl-accepting chemotaxis protein [Quisquiliibacterium sp.]